MAKFLVSRINKFLEPFEGEPVFVGVDVHKRSYSVAVRRKDGLCETWTTSADPSSFVRCLLEFDHSIECVAQESGPTGFGLARALSDAGITCIVAAPCKIPRPISSGAKTDRLDCIKLANYAANGMLKSIAIPTIQEEGERSLIRRRFQIADSIRRTKQRIKSLLLVTGYPEPAGLKYWSKQSITSLETLEISPAFKFTLDSHLRELSSLQSDLQEVVKNLEGLVKERYEQKHSRMRSVPGVGFIVATTFLLEIFQPERFNRPEEVVSYIGLAPIMQQSGERSARGRLMPVGQKRLRSLLIEAAWVWQGKDAKVKTLYNKLVAKTGVAQKAIVAIARRMAILLWKLSLSAQRKSMAVS